MKSFNRNGKPVTMTVPTDDLGPVARTVACCNKKLVVIDGITYKCNQDKGHVGRCRNEWVKGVLNSIAQRVC